MRAWRKFVSWIVCACVFTASMSIMFDQRNVHREWSFSRNLVTSFFVLHFNFHAVEERLLYIRFRNHHPLNYVLVHACVVSIAQPTILWQSGVSVTGASSWFGSVCWFATMEIHWKIESKREIEKKENKINSFGSRFHVRRSEFALSLFRGMTLNYEWTLVNWLFKRVFQWRNVRKNLLPRCLWWWSVFGSIVG